MGGIAVADAQAVFELQIDAVALVELQAQIEIAVEAGRAAGGAEAVGAGRRGIEAGFAAPAIVGWHGLADRQIGPQDGLRGEVEPAAQLQHRRELEAGMLLRAHVQRQVAAMFLVALDPAVDQVEVDKRLEIEPLERDLVGGPQPAGDREHVGTALQLLAQPAHDRRAVTTLRIAYELCLTGCRLSLSIERFLDEEEIAQVEVR